MSDRLARRDAKRVRHILEAAALGVAAHHGGYRLFAPVAIGG